MSNGVLDLQGITPYEAPVKGSSVFVEVPSYLLNPRSKGSYSRPKRRFTAYGKCQAVETTTYPIIGGNPMVIVKEREAEYGTITIGGIELFVVGSGPGWDDLYYKAHGLKQHCKLFNQETLVNV